MKRHKAGTIEQVRDDIDQGRARDKVAHPDPAAAPLGADDEAAGRPLTDSEADLARFDGAGREGLSPAPVDHRERGRLGPFILVLASLVIVVATVLVLSQ